MKEIREPAVSGSLYPDRPEILSRDVKQYIENAKKEKIEGEIIALVSPHAGYMYSGQVAAYAYKLIEGKTFDTVVVVAPSHQALFKGVSLYDRGGYRTPLGVVPIDVELSKKMMEKRKRSIYSRSPFPGAFFRGSDSISSGGFEIIQTRSHCDGALLELGDLPIPCLSDCRDSEGEKCFIDCQFRPLPFPLL